MILNLIAKKISRPQKINSLTTKISKVIEREEDKIRSNHRIGSLKVRTTGKIAQLIWKRVDFIEFDQQWLHQLDQNLTEKKIQLHFNASPPISKGKSIYSEGKGFLYCVYKYTGEKNKKKLTLARKKPLLNVSGYSRSRTTKALNTLSSTLSCSKELQKISRILELCWKMGVKT
ncbi:uncharacterized protein METZ01_LOCUS103915 [marine metagenome]|uniref:Uncharacterized protein n=1 Tax=marine metagenome TaxID=408172 RepID=A0A381WFH0_9ZZZZ